MQVWLWEILVNGKPIGQLEGTDEGHALEEATYEFTDQVYAADGNTLIATAKKLNAEGYPYSINLMGSTT